MGRDDRRVDLDVASAGNVPWLLPKRLLPATVPTHERTPAPLLPRSGLVQPSAAANRGVASGYDSCLFLLPSPSLGVRPPFIPSLPMKARLLLLILTFLGGAMARASVGENETQVEARYGPPTRQMPASLPRGAAKMYSFRSMTVTVEFIEGKSESECVSHPCGGAFLGNGREGVAGG